MNANSMETTDFAIKLRVAQLEIKANVVSVSLLPMSDDSFNHVNGRIRKLVEEFGLELELFYMSNLLARINFSTGTTVSNANQLRLLKQEFTALIYKPHFISLICFAIEKGLKEEQVGNLNDLLCELSEKLELNEVESLAVGLALKHSTSSAIRQASKEFFIKKFRSFVKAYLASGAEISSKGNIPKIITLHLVHLLQYKNIWTDLQITEAQAKKLVQNLQNGREDGPEHLAHFRTLNLETRMIFSQKDMTARFQLFVRWKSQRFNNINLSFIKNLPIDVKSDVALAARSSVVINEIMKKSLFSVMCGSAFQIGGFTNFRRMFENYISILNVHTDYFMEILESTNCINHSEKDGDVAPGFEKIKFFGHILRKKNLPGAKLTVLAGASSFFFARSFEVLLSRSIVDSKWQENLLKMKDQKYLFSLVCLTALSNFDAEKERAELGKQLDELEQLEKQFIVKVLKKDFQTTVFCLSKLWEDKLQKVLKGEGLMLSELNSCRNDEDVHKLLRGFQEEDRESLKLKTEQIRIKKQGTKREGGSSESDSNQKKKRWESRSLGSASRGASKTSPRKRINLE